MTNRCKIPDQETHGEFYCTRDEGHEGPCAAVRRHITVLPPIYPKPSLTVDCVITRGNGEREILLIQRGKDPFKGSWALPGGFVNQGEEPSEAAARELREETGVEISRPELVGVFGKAGRDPRGWIVSVAYAADVTDLDVTVAAADDASDARWLSLSEVLSGLVALAFDHLDIVKAAIVKEMLDVMNRVSDPAIEILCSALHSGRWASCAHLAQAVRDACDEYNAPGLLRKKIENELGIGLEATTNRIPCPRCSGTGVLLSERSRSGEVTCGTCFGGCTVAPATAEAWLESERTRLAKLHGEVGK